MSSRNTHGGSPQDTRRIVLSVAIGSLAVATVLASLLISYDLSVLGHFRVRTTMGLFVIVYTGMAVIYAFKNWLRTASWMLISLYLALLAIMLFQWGINAPVSILTLCFVVLLPGILLGSRYIPPILISSVLLIISAHIVHSLQVYIPDLAPLGKASTYWDIGVFIPVIVILALLSWLSKRQTEQSLARAFAAESKLLEQKQTIATKLKAESLALRQIQLKQFQQLYQFALIGQTTAATLHELSNQLAELNLDIDDITQQDKNSQAIHNAKHTIQHINHTVRQSRQQLHIYSGGKESFDATPIIKSSVADMASKFASRQTQLRCKLNAAAQVPLQGSPMALRQIISILLHNALDAAQDSDNAWVEAHAEVSQGMLHITVTDSGPGIEPELRKRIFKPKTSKKPSGLGVGLYIAKHLAVTQFYGTLKLNTTALNHGASFTLSIPLNTEPANAHEK